LRDETPESAKTAAASGPEAHRPQGGIVMSTHATHTSPLKFDSVTRYLSWDHDRLDGLLGEATTRVENGHLAQALSLFRAFDTGLRRHIRIEENVLFPLFESRTGTRAGGGPTAVMRAEHRAIEAELDRMRLALELGDASEYGSGLATLHGVLGAHNLKEESVLYPTTDDLLEASERLDLVDRLSRA
jgi:iron-sulfur cluster repair protein YtfE (RIC family)